MNEVIGFIIAIETNDAYINIGPCFTDGPINDTLIKDNIRTTLSANGQAYYNVDEVEDIFFIGLSDTFDMIYSPKISDVWPAEFGHSKTRKIHYKKEVKE